MILSVFFSFHFFPRNDEIGVSQVWIKKFDLVLTDINLVQQFQQHLPKYLEEGHCIVT